MYTHVPIAQNETAWAWGVETLTGLSSLEFETLESSGGRESY